MLALSLLPFLLVTAAIAVPSHRDTSTIPASALSLPANQSVLIAPTYAPSYVTVAVGLLNYTCSDTVKEETIGGLCDRLAVCSQQVKYYVV